MLTAISRDSEIQRLIGWLTIALGIGVCLPRPGIGLHQILEAAGTRSAWAAMLLGTGFLAVSLSYLPWRRARTFLLSLLTTAWLLLLLIFLEAQMWGATAQATVIIAFTLSSGYRTWRTTK